MRRCGRYLKPSFIVKPKKGHEKKLQRLKDAVDGKVVLVKEEDLERQRFRKELRDTALPESETFSRLGMGGYVSADAPGFEGIFRQTWRDFYVTEMPEEGVRLSRLPDLTIPSFPGEQMTEAADKNSIFAEMTEEEKQSALEAQMKEVEEPAKQGGDAVMALDTDKMIHTECYLHKKNVPHATAITALSQILRISPKHISVAGIKDLIGDTIQRVRFRGVSPHSLRTVNSQAQNAIRRRDCFMRCSNYSYQEGPLTPGDLYGNHFKIILRDVDARPEDIEKAVQHFGKNGFPNYYGCQRFSWFGGRQDASFAVAQGDYLRFAFLYLDYTGGNRSLRELLQRKKKYPLPLQDAYRRQCIKMLQRFNIEPADLDKNHLFSKCPNEGDALFSDASRYSPVQKIVIESLRAAFLRLEGQDRRMKCQPLGSYLWNQALTLRLKHFGGQQVMLGDFVVRKGIKSELLAADDREGWTNLIDVVTPHNIHEFDIEDVLHPGFMFERAPLPDSRIRDIYYYLCERYGLNWNHKHTRDGLTDFTENPRPIVVKPIDLAYTMEPKDRTVTVEFALERGSYANVAVTELMKATRCVGQDAVAFVPLHESKWDSLGTKDVAYVETFEDVYPGFVHGEGFLGDEEFTGIANEASIYELAERAELEGKSLLREDPYQGIKKWSEENLIKQVERRELDGKRVASRLFEKPLADSMTTEEVESYLSHTTQLPPNANERSIRHKLNKRAKKSIGTPVFKPRVALSQGVQGKTKKKAQYRSLNKDTWNRHFT